MAILILFCLRIFEYHHPGLSATEGAEVSQIRPSKRSKMSLCPSGTSITRGHSFRDDFGGILSKDGLGSKFCLDGFVFCWQDANRYPEQLGHLVDSIPC